MTVSSIGSSSSVQSLYLQYLQSLLGSSSVGSDALSSLQDGSTDSLSISPQAQWMSQSQSSNPFKTDMDKLGQLIQSGDLSGAKDAYATIQKNMQAHQSSGSQGSDPMATALAAIGTALDSGDSTSAQKAWESAQSKIQSLAQPGAGSDQNPMKNDLDQLGKLISSGDLTGAKTLFSTIQDRMKSHAGSGSNTNSGSTSSNSSSDIDSAFSVLGTALDSGDATSAQKAWSSLQQEFQNLASKQKSGQSDDSSNSGIASVLEAQLLAASMGLSGLTPPVSE